MIQAHESHFSILRNRHEGRGNLTYTEDKSCPLSASEASHFSVSDLFLGFFSFVFSHLSGYLEQQRLCAVL
uniref:Uncharacterized protein n=1 Tax=Anguilla anguilla TaxID=7936 RepID=A0A0E9REC2_ANGAN